MDRVPVFLILIASFAAALPVRAAEGIPGWQQVLDTMLKQAEAEAAHGGRQRALEAEQPARAVHPAVGQFIRYFRTGGAAAWSGSIRRLNRIRPMIEKVFTEEGVPEELIWLGLVESGYRPTARSPRNAAGVWQFIPETARRFGLAVDGRRDERADTGKATRAAARYLRFLYSVFGDWNLVLAAYNAGENRVQSAIERGGTRDFWILAERGYLPRETRAYVPAVLAAQVLGAGLEPPRTAHTRAAATTGQVLEASFSLSP